MGDRPKVPPLKLKLTQHHRIRAWVHKHDDTMFDYIVEHQLARGQIIIKKLEAIVDIHARAGIQSEIADMATTLLHDPHAIEEGEEEVH